MTNYNVTLMSARSPHVMYRPEQISTTLNRYTHDARDYADLRVRAVFAGLAADDLLASGKS